MGIQCVKTGVFSIFLSTVVKTTFRCVIIYCVCVCVYIFILCVYIFIVYVNILRVYILFVFIYYL